MLPKILKARFVQDLRNAMRERQREKIYMKAMDLALKAEAHDMILTIERKPATPLAMRRHFFVIECRDRLIRPGEPGFRQ